MLAGRAASVRLIGYVLKGNLFLHNKKANLDAATINLGFSYQLTFTPNPLSYCCVRTNFQLSSYFSCCNTLLV